MKLVKCYFGYVVLFLMLVFGVWYCRIPNINTCTMSELVMIEGIGYTRASIIVENRPYRDYKEIEMLEKIGKSTVKKLKKNTKIF